MKKELSRRYGFIDSEKLLLETVFTRNPHPNRATIRALADELAANKRQVYMWFTYKRSWFKKETTQDRSLQCKYIVYFALCMNLIFNAREPDISCTCTYIGVFIGCLLMEDISSDAINLNSRI